MQDRISQPTLRLSAAKFGDVIKLRDGDSRIFTVGKSTLSGYAALENRGHIMHAAESEPIKLLVSALDTSAMME